MKIKFTTNLDKYKTNYWPKNLTMPPRKGDMVMVSEPFIPILKSQRLPTKLEVVQVTWYDDSVICELWYNKSDIEIFNLEIK